MNDEWIATMDDYKKLQDELQRTHEAWKHNSETFEATVIAERDALKVEVETAKANAGRAESRALRLGAEVERLRAERAELRRLLLIAYDALFFERGMTPQDRDAMRHALETIPREVTPIHTDP